MHSTLLVQITGTFMQNTRGENANINNDGHKYKIIFNMVNSNDPHLLVMV